MKINTKYTLIQRQKNAIVIKNHIEMNHGKKGNNFCWIFNFVEKFWKIDLHILILLQDVGCIDGFHTKQ